MTHNDIRDKSEFMRNKPIQKTQPGKMGPKLNLSPKKHSPSHPLTDFQSAVIGNGTRNKATTIFYQYFHLRK